MCFWDGQGWSIVAKKYFYYDQYSEDHLLPLLRLWEQKIYIKKSLLKVDLNQKNGTKIFF